MVLHRHRHWHFLILWYFGSVLGVHTLHFMSVMRGHETLRVWLSLGRLLPMGEVSEILPREVEAKVLERADDYLPWIQAGQINLGGGPTTDMQEFAEFDTAQSAAAMAVINRLMNEGRQGAYLRFTSTLCALPAGDG